MLVASRGEVKFQPGFVSKLIRNVPFLTSLEMSPFVLVPLLFLVLLFFLLLAFVLVFARHGAHRVNRRLRLTSVCGAESCAQGNKFQQA